MIPVVTGVELAQQFVSIPFKQITVIFLTNMFGMTKWLLLKEFLQQTAECFLSKTSSAWLGSLWSHFSAALPLHCLQIAIRLGC